MTTTQNTKDILTKEWAEMGYEKANEILALIPPIERLEVLKNTPSSMTPYEGWIKKSKAELIKYYMNAVVTQSCLGHSKAERNIEAAKEYLQLMSKYGIPTPPDEICYILGEFNGAGSQ